MISKPLNQQFDHYLPVNELVSNSDLIKVILPFKQQRTKILKKYLCIDNIKLLITIRL